VVLVSDGYDNAPPAGAETVLALYRNHLDPQRRTAIVHCNPVFDTEELGLKRLHPQIPTVGLRDGEDLAMMLGFARFAEGAAPLAELEAYLAGRVQELLRSTQEPLRAGNQVIRPGQDQGEAAKTNHPL
jgi:hypothetical protein